MTDEEWERLQSFVVAERAAKDVYLALAQQNTAGKSPRAAMEQSLAYERALMKLQKASADLAAAKREILGV